jgi:hypothetical protein
MLKSPARSRRTEVETEVKPGKKKSRKKTCSDRVGGVGRELALLNEAMMIATIL